MADEAPFCLDLIWCVRVLFGSMMLLVVGLATTRSMGIRIVNRGREVFFEEALPAINAQSFGVLFYVFS